MFLSVNSESLKASGSPGSSSASRQGSGGLVVELDELHLLSFQALSLSSLFVAQRLARRVLKSCSCETVNSSGC